MGEEQERVIVANMIVLPNDILKEIQEKCLTNGNLDFRKIVKDPSKWDSIPNAPIKTTFEYGKDNLDGVIRYLTPQNHDPNFGRAISLRYNTLKVPYLWAFSGKNPTSGMVVIKRGRLSYEKNYDLSTRHGRIITMTAWYGMKEGTKTKGNEKEAEQ